MNRRQLLRRIGASSILTIGAATAAGRTIRTPVDDLDSVLVVRDGEVVDEIANPTLADLDANGDVGIQRCSWKCCGDCNCEDCYCECWCNDDGNCIEP